MSSRHQYAVSASDPTINPVELQTHLNSIMRRVDLTAKMTSPLVIGLLLTGGRSTVVRGLLAVGGWSILTAWPVYALWRGVYDTYPGLRVKPVPTLDDTPARNNLLAVLWRSWKIWRFGTIRYSRDPVFLASLSFCFLHFTVLSDHHPLTTAFLAEENMSALALGIARAAGSVTGILATAVWPTVVETCNDDNVRAGSLALWAFWGCVTLIAVEFAFHTPIETVFMLTMIVISRLFLWQVDLFNVAIIQRFVPQNERSEITATQVATCQLLEMLMGLFGMLLSRPADFKYLVWLSAGGISASLALLLLWQRFVLPRMLRGRTGAGLTLLP